MWLDTTGTIYISIVLGFPYGLCVGLINSMISALFFYGYQSMIYYFVSFAVAFSADYVVRRVRKKYIWIKLWTVVCVAGSFVAVLLTFFADRGIPADYWSRQLYEYLAASGFHPYLSTALSVTTIKIIDTLLTVIIVAAFIKLTPSKLKSDEYVIRNQI